MSSSEDEDSEQLDPRVRDKLEELNECTNNINKLEKQFEESNALFRNTLNDYSQRLKKLAQKLGKCVDEARPYYEAKINTASLHDRCQNAAIQYERSCQLHAQAKETITIAEQRFSKKADNDFDSAWQEMLNHATIKFMEAETLKKQSESEHSKCMQTYLNEEKRVAVMEKQLKSAIKKSKEYFEESASVQSELNNLKSLIEKLGKIILDSKKAYSKTLKELEMISEEIHEKRAQNIVARSLKREPGVGAEVKDSDAYTEQVPQLTIDSQLCHFQVFPNISPKLLTSTSSINSSQQSLNSSKLDDNLVQAFNTHCNTDHISVDSAKLDERTTTSVVDNGFVEIDL